MNMNIFILLGAVFMGYITEITALIARDLNDCPRECICLSQTQILCNNGGLTDIPVHRIPVKVEYLSLSKNNITYLKTEAFSRFRQLRKLSLDGNNMSKISQFAFKGLSNMKEICIQHTSLEKLEKFSFSALQNVSLIRLPHNKIKWIEEFAFAGTSNVEQLLLTDNPLYRIDSNAFSGLRNVGHLIFPNGIRQIEADSFNGLQLVGYMKLAFMDLKQLQEYTFRGLSQIYVLTVQDSDLGVVRKNAFYGLVEVGSLNILNNKIDAMEEFKIQLEDNVKIVRLLGNHILDIPNASSVIVKATENFTVVGNHFPCDCRMPSLEEGPLANRTSANFTQKNYCISPFYSNGKTIFDSAIDIRNMCDNFEGYTWSSTSCSVRNTIQPSCIKSRPFKIIAMLLFFLITAAYLRGSF